MQWHGPSLPSQRIVRQTTAVVSVLGMIVKGPVRTGVGRRKKRAPVDPGRGESGGGAAEPSAAR
jgi:hypothetical protein